MPFFALSSPGPSMPDRRYRVLVIASHPVQYHGQLFGLTAASAPYELHLNAYFLFRLPTLAVSAQFAATSPAPLTYYANRNF
jgi:hypothetical protein